jgi:hypothetical protein
MAKRCLLLHRIKLWITPNSRHHCPLLAVCCRLLSALTLCEDREAARLVFMGWPGQGEVEAAAPQFDMEFDLPVSPPAAAAAEGGSSSDAAAGAGGVTLQLQRSPSSAAVSAAAAAAAAVPAVLQLEEHWRPGSRQLGYVTVTRPLRQVRFRVGDQGLRCEHA